MIAIGVQMGGPEQKESLIRNKLIQAMNVAEGSREPSYNNGSEAWINPIFIVPGSIWKSEFEGYKLSHFSKKEKGLVVQIAVPQAVANGEGIVEFIGISLREAVKLGATFFFSENINFATLKAEKIICLIEARLSELR